MSSGHYVALTSYCLVMMNRAAQELVRLFPHRGDQTRLAAELEVDQSYASRLMRGVKEAGLDVRRRCLRQFGIPMEWWDIPSPESGEHGAVDPDAEAS